MNEDPLTFNKKIRMNAALISEHLSQHAGFELGNDAESINWLDVFIRRRREIFVAKDAVLDQLSAAIRAELPIMS